MIRYVFISGQRNTGPNRTEGSLQISKMWQSSNTYLGTTVKIKIIYEEMKSLLYYFVLPSPV